MLKTTKPKDAFKQWASLFSGKFFVMMSVYADESGTCPNKAGLIVPTVYGYIATKDYWDEFRKEWHPIR